MNACKLFILFLLMVSIDVTVIAQMHYEQLRFSRYTVKEGLPQSDVYGLFQDSKGFVWFGTQHGLCRFDGSNFLTYRQDQNDPHSLSSNLVYRIGEDKEGKLWVLTADGLVNLLDPTTGHFRHLRFYNRTTKKNILILDVNTDSQGTLWLASTEGLLMFNRKYEKTIRFRFKEHPLCSVTDTVGRLLVRQNGRLLISAMRGVFEINPKTGVNKPLLIIPEASGKSTFANELMEGRNGELWAVTYNNGLFRVSPDGRVVSHMVHQPDDPESLSSDFCTGLQFDKNGFLWVTTYEGLSIFNPVTQKWKRVKPIAGDNYSLLDNWIFCVLKDREGLMWVGSRLGLHKYDPSLNRFLYYYHNPTSPTSLSFSNTDPVVEDTAGNLWIGTRGGGLDYFNRKSGTFTHFKYDLNKPGTLSDSNVLGLYLDTNQVLWVGTSNGLNRLDNPKGTFRKFFHVPSDPTSLSSNFITAIRRDRRGRLWVGTYGNGLNRQKSDGTFERFANDPDDNSSLSGNTVQGLEMDSQGRIWVATEKGICRYLPETNTFKQYTPSGRSDVNLSTRVTFAIVSDSKGTVWAGGHHGLERWDPATDTFKSYTSREGLKYNGVVGIVEDNRGHLWISTFNGVARFDPRLETFKFYDQSEGLQSNEFNFGAIKLRTSGELVFTGMHGFNIFHPDSIRDNPYRPPVVISTLRKYVVNTDPLTVLEEQNISHEQSLTFDYSNNLLAFEFTAMSFSNPALNQYAYQLAGQSDQWYQLGTKREVTFAGLAPGEYILRVKASNSDGIWNEVPTELAITVLPPWWRTWWAYGLYLLLFGFALRAYIVFRSRALRRENRVLEEKVALRTDQLQRKSNELETSLAELKSTQTQLIQKEKLASLGELTAGIAHEIQNPLNFVNNYSEVNMELIEELQEEAEKGDTEEIKALLTDLSDNERKIHHHGRRADAIVRGMLEHARATPGEKVPTDLNALADEYLRLAYHGLRAKDPDFQCELITDFDPHPGRVEVAPSELGRVLLNLFNNAFYAVRQRQLVATDQAYTPTVWVSTTKLPLLPGEGRGEVEGGGCRYGEVVIKVRDNGTGMPPEVQAKIFQPFFTTKPTGEGTGLGLSLSYDIVTKGHGGTLRVKSVPGEGTEFLISVSEKMNL